jgi:hypothetical protein
MQCTKESSGLNIPGKRNCSRLEKRSRKDRLKGQRKKSTIEDEDWTKEKGVAKTLF